MTIGGIYETVMFLHFTLAKFGLAAYFAKLSLARLMKGPSGVDSIEA